MMCVFLLQLVFLSSVAEAEPERLACVQIAVIRPWSVLN